MNRPKNSCLVSVYSTNRVGCFSKSPVTFWLPVQPWMSHKICGAPAMFEGEPAKFANCLALVKFTILFVETKMIPHG